MRPAVLWYGCSKYDIFFLRIWFFLCGSRTIFSDLQEREDVQTCLKKSAHRCQPFIRRVPCNNSITTLTVHFRRIQSFWKPMKRPSTWQAQLTSTLFSTAVISSASIWLLFSYFCFIFSKLLLIKASKFSKSSTAVCTILLNKSGSISSNFFFLRSVSMAVWAISFM